MFDAIASIFGYVLRFWLEIFGNYGVAIIMFTITVKVILLPLTIKQQKSTEKTQELQPKINELQEKYKDDKEKLSQEYQKFMAENKFNPFGGCILAIVQLLVLLGVFYVVANPLKHMHLLNENQIKAKLESVIIDEDYSGDTALYIAKVEEFAGSGEKIDSTEFSGDVIPSEMRTKFINNYISTNRYYELRILNSHKDLLDSDKEIDMNFLGINLGDITAQHMSDWKLWIFPILTTIFYYLSMWMITRKQKKTQKTMKDADGNEIQMPNMMAMNFMMPLLSGWISFSVPQGMGLYWFSNSLLQIIIQFITEKATNKDKKDDNVLKPIEAIKDDEPISKSKQKKIEKNKKKK
ncbi:MAG: YidC/Oxa1 family membrane protein insertase [Clostridia bacterium]|nr:YidC/Oxa1 family membrane protein insertase [Clostridia bacterium]